MRVTVTGGAGYIGSVVTEVLLADGHDVLVLDNLVKGGPGASAAAIAHAAAPIRPARITRRVPFSSLNRPATQSQPGRRSRRPGRGFVHPRAPLGSRRVVWASSSSASTRVVTDMNNLVNRAKAMTISSTATARARVMAEDMGIRRPGTSVTDPSSLRYTECPVDRPNTKCRRVYEGIP